MNIRQLKYYYYYFVISLNMIYYYISIFFLLWFVFLCRFIVFLLVIVYLLILILIQFIRLTEDFKNPFYFPGSTPSNKLFPDGFIDDVSKLDLKPIPDNVCEFKIRKKIVHFDKPREQGLFSRSDFEDFKVSAFWTTVDFKREFQLNVDNWIDCQMYCKVCSH